MTKENTQSEEKKHQSIFDNKESKIGPVIGSVIIIVVILLGGLFFLDKIIREKKEQIKFENNLEQTKTEQTTNNFFEEDFDQINIDEVDQKINEVDQEFESLK